MSWVDLVVGVWNRLGSTQIGLLVLGCTMTIIGAACTFLAQPYHQEPRTLRGFLRFCLPPHVVAGQQARLDLIYATIKKAVRILWRWAFVSDITFAYLFYNALSRLGGGDPKAEALRHAPTGWERVVFIVVGIVILDFYTFFAHYLLHKIPLMWPFHKVHHSALTLIPVTNLRFHPVQEVWDALWNSAGVGVWIAAFAYVTASRLADVTILGINAVILISCFSFHHLRHSHIYMRYPRWLERFIMSPAQHQIHHSREARHFDRNFGLLLSCWDRMLGTIVYSETAPVTALGLATGQQDYMSVRGLFTAPFVDIARMVHRRGKVEGQALESVARAAAAEGKIASGGAPDISPSPHPVAAVSEHVA